MIQHKLFSIDLSPHDSLWRYTESATGAVLSIGHPVVEIDGRPLRLELDEVKSLGNPHILNNGVAEHRFAGVCPQDRSVTLQLVFRTSPDNPMVRFQYIISAPAVRRLTKPDKKDALTYLSFGFQPEDEATEVRFSEFYELVHSFCLQEERIHTSSFDHRLDLMGPLVTGTNGTRSFLVAYEHGSQYPDAYLHFRLQPDRSVSLAAVKGNYYHGRSFERPFETIWFQAGAVPGGKDDLAEVYRDFVLRSMSQNLESRKPYIFYNTWNYQERNRAWNKKPYLESMQQDRILKEIEVAHRMGVEVYVIDTGWFQKTGDWQVNLARFPDGLRAVKQKLDEYGMKLGLWFNPTVAAVSSTMAQEHQDCIVTLQGTQPPPHPIWETEESYSLCLVSRYADAFARELIRLVKEIGVTYFKWDAIQQYACDDFRHDHGGAENPQSERGDCSAFEQGRAMSRIVDQLCRACPEAIVDFDITEGHRFVGLGFLAVGKYFLINNGPYYNSFNLPPATDGNANMFFWPGPARGWICRYPLTFDKWIPSVLFLTHYLPDDPTESQMINLASLMLGQNGIWGDLLTISPEGVELFARMLEQYKQIRDDITEASPVLTGKIGGNPEIHEKISRKTGRGIVVIFASSPGSFNYITSEKVGKPYDIATPGLTVTIDSEQHAHLLAEFVEPGAKIVFFGISAVSRS